jgi:hypothetical protein
VSGRRVALLGSIATDKNLSVLTDVLGRRLRFPREFVGRGDVSRGGLNEAVPSFLAQRRDRVDACRPPGR